MARELLWHGKNETEARKMDLKEFMKYIPAGSRRSLKRGLTDLQKIFLKELKKSSPDLKTHCRDLVIIPEMLGKSFKVYNGKEFRPVEIALEMLGHRLGEFSHTRKPVAHSAAGIGATRSSKAVSAR